MRFWSALSSANPLPLAPRPACARRGRGRGLRDSLPSPAASRLRVRAGKTGSTRSPSKNRFVVTWKASHRNSIAAGPDGSRAGVTAWLAIALATAARCRCANRRDAADAASSRVDGGPGHRVAFGAPPARRGVALVASGHTPLQCPTRGNALILGKASAAGIKPAADAAECNSAAPGSRLQVGAPRDRRPRESAPHAGRARCAQRCKWRVEPAPSRELMPARPPIGGMRQCHRYGATWRYSRQMTLLQNHCMPIAISRFLRCSDRE